MQSIPQYYRQARMKALVTVYPELASEYAEGGVGRFSYPRPISEPPSPSSSRHTTPAASVHGSDDEDEVDEEKEVCSTRVIYSLDTANTLVTNYYKGNC